MGILSKLFRKRDLTEASILNSGLRFAMEFGENWLQPIQERLSERYNSLTNEELDRYNKTCKLAMKSGHSFVYEYLVTIFDSQQTIREVELKNKMVDYMKEQYPWISKSNLSRLFSQSCYYAWRDGLTDCLK